MRSRRFQQIRSHKATLALSTMKVYVLFSCGEEGGECVDPCCHGLARNMSQTNRVSNRINIDSDKSSMPSEMILTPLLPARSSQISSQM